jgi:hypothetical protein
MTVYEASTWVIPVIIAITLHEAAHGFVGRCHVVESLMRVRRVSQLKSCGGGDFAPRLHG